MNDHETRMSAFKVVVAWLLTIVSAVTLQQIAAFLAIVFTGLQIYVTWRDKIRRRRKE